MRAGSVQPHIPIMSQLHGNVQSNSVANCITKDNYKTKETVLLSLSIPEVTITTLMIIMIIMMNIVTRK